MIHFSSRNVVVDQLNFQDQVVGMEVSSSFAVDVICQK